VRQIFGFVVFMPKRITLQAAPALNRASWLAYCKVKDR
jgi:hypothetical protein